MTDENKYPGIAFDRESVPSKRPKSWIKRSIESMVYEIMDKIQKSIVYLVNNAEHFHGTGLAREYGKREERKT